MYQNDQQVATTAIFRDLFQPLIGLYLYFIETGEKFKEGKSNDKTKRMTHFIEHLNSFGGLTQRREIEGIHDNDLTKDNKITDFQKGIFGKTQRYFDHYNPFLAQIKSYIQDNKPQISDAIAYFIKRVHTEANPVASIIINGIHRKNEFINIEENQDDF